MEIKDAVALITGGGTGVGAAIAGDLCATGARVMVAGRREERLAETAALVRASGGEIDYRVADIAVPEACERLVAATVERFGPVDVLVNNAAITAHGKPLHEWSVAEWDQVMATNVRAAFVSSSLVLPGMRDRKRGDQPARQYVDCRPADPVADLGPLVG